MVKNQKFYKTSKSYKNAWESGHKRCTPIPKSVKEKPKTKPSVKKSRPHPNNAKQGYRDDCNTARRGFTQNHYLYQNDVNYRNAWEDGVRRCEERGYRLGY